MDAYLKSIAGIREFNFPSYKLKLTKEELAQLMGYNVDKLSPPVEEMIHIVLDITPKFLDPKGGFAVLSDKKVKFENDHILINGTTLRCEKTISRYLKSSESLAILVASIGSRLENLSKQFMDEGDLLKGYIIDKAASELVEKTADLLESELAEYARSKHFKITNRYSPGYCGWSVNDQHNLFSFLPENFCGVSLTESALMLPIKSISAIVGIGKDVKKENYQCSICDTEFCYKRDKVK